MSRAKRNALLLLIAAGGLTLVLAMSLPNLVLAPGEPFTLGQPDTVIGGGGLGGGDLLLLVVRGVLGLALILLPFYVVYSLTNKEGRRRLVGNLIVLVLVLLLADYLQNHPLTPPEQQQTEEAAIGESTPALQSGLPESVFTPNPPTWLTPAIILIASALVLVILLAVVWYVRQRRQPPDLALTRLAETAQETIDTLQSGGDFEVSVIRCYQEMSRVVKAEKGLAREAAMTPREFEDRLINVGLPPEAVRTLTRLFENVRYGHRASGAGEIDTAVSCLTDIVNACGGRYELG